MMITRIFTASAFNKFTNIAPESVLLEVRSATFVAAKAPKTTAAPPSTAEILALNPEMKKTVAATDSVATT